MTESDTKKTTKSLWSRRLTSDEEKKLIAKAFAALCGLNLKEDWKEVTKMTALTTMVGKAMDKLNAKDLFTKYGTETITKVTKKGNRTQTKGKELTIDDVFKIPEFYDVYEKLKEKKFDGLLFFKPTEKTPNMREIATAKFLPNRTIDNGVTTMDKATEVVNTILKNTPYEKPTKDGSKPTAPKTVTLDKATIDAINKKEPSVEEQIKNTVTKVAKNKELMNLSKEQLKDYLREAYEISDENALNNMMNAVVSKRAELLANKQLKHDELTEIDIGKLQEQSQRDFEKKLQDQNLRYILPAQIEKRERLVQNRLNPELLKGGY